MMESVNWGLYLAQSCTGCYTFYMIRRGGVREMRDNSLIDVEFPFHPIPACHSLFLMLDVLGPDNCAVFSERCLFG